MGHALRDEARRTEGFAAQEALFSPEREGLGDPLRCEEEGLEWPADSECRSDEPPKEELEQLANDSAVASRLNMMTAVNQRLKGFLAAAEYASQSAQHMDQDRSFWQSLWKAFDLVSGVLIGGALSGMKTAGGAVLKDMLKASCKLGGAAIEKAGSTNKLTFADFNADMLAAMAEAELQVAEVWKIPVVRAHILASAYPHKLGPELELATQRIANEAYRLQYATTLTSWMAESREGKPSWAEIGRIELEIDFAPNGSYSFVSARVPGMGEAMAKGLTDDVPGGVDRARTALSLGELMTTGPGVRIVLRDQNNLALTLEAPNRILEPEGKILAHGVTRWGDVKLGKGRAPIAYAHAFIFQELAGKTLEQMGLQE